MKEKVFFFFCNWGGPVNFSNEVFYPLHTDSACSTFQLTSSTWERFDGSIWIHTGFFFLLFYKSFYFGDMTVQPKHMNPSQGHPSICLPHELLSLTEIFLRCCVPLSHGGRAPKGKRKHWEKIRKKRVWFQTMYGFIQSILKTSIHVHENQLNLSTNASLQALF